MTEENELEIIALLKKNNGLKEAGNELALLNCELFWRLLRYKNLQTPELEAKMGVFSTKKEAGR